MAVPDVVVFDLFGTLVFFDGTRVPTEEIAGRRVPMTVPGLEDLLRESLPGVAVVDFLRTLKRTTGEVADEKRRLGIEIPTRVRFERALAVLGAAPATAASSAVEMAARHMDSLARAVVCPRGRPELLETLRRRHRVALLSNFDDGATARRVIAEAGLAPYFETVVVSEDLGLRKPAREIFEITCRRLDVEASRCLYVGDTVVEDIEGATGAGLAAVWVRGDSAPEIEAPAVAAGVVGDVEELPVWLERRGVSARGGASR